MNDIKVFSKTDCVQCKMTKRFLQEHSAKFEEINIDDEPKQIDYVKKLGFSTVPVVVAGDMSFSGFQPQKLRSLLT